MICGVPRRRVRGVDLRRSVFLVPVIALIAFVIVSMYMGTATATEAAAFGVVGAMVLAGLQGSLT